MIFVFKFSPHICKHAGVTVAATAHTLLECAGKCEQHSFYVPPEEDIIGVMSGEQGVPSCRTACANRFLSKTFDTRTSELQCENMGVLCLPWLTYQ